MMVHGERVELAASIVPARRIRHWLGDLDPLGERRPYTADERAAADAAPRAGWAFSEELMARASGYVVAAPLPRPGKPARDQWCREVSQYEADLLIASELSRHAPRDQAAQLLAMAGLDEPVELWHTFEGLGRRSGRGRDDPRSVCYSIVRGARHSDPVIRMAQRRVDPLIEREVAPIHLDAKGAPTAYDMTVAGGGSFMARPVAVGRTLELRGELGAEVELELAPNVRPHLFDRGSSAITVGAAIYSDAEGRAAADGVIRIGTAAPRHVPRRGHALVRRHESLPSRPCFVLLTSSGAPGDVYMADGRANTAPPTRRMSMRQVSAPGAAYVDCVLGRQIAWSGAGAIDGNPGGNGARAIAFALCVAHDDYTDAQAIELADEHAHLAAPLAVL